MASKAVSPHRICVLNSLWIRSLELNPIAMLLGPHQTFIHASLSFFTHRTIMATKYRFKAWRYPPNQSTWEGPQILELRDVEIDPPGKGQALVKMYAVSLNYSRELVVARNKHPGGTLTQGSDGGGLIPCSDGAGQIVAVGEEVHSWKIGDRVHSLLYEGWPGGPVGPANFEGMVGSHVQGCLTQYRIFPEEFMMPIPPHLSYEEASILPCAGVTLAASTHFPLPPNSTVLVQGSGGVSVLAAMLSKASGARVIATTSSHDKTEKYKRVGVDDVINYRDIPEWGDKVKELTGEKGVDLVLDMGGQGSICQSLNCVKQAGKVCLVGLLPSGETGASLGEVTNQILFKQVTVVGILGGSKEESQSLNAFLESQKVELKSVIDERVFEWSEAVEAHEYLASGKHFGKVVIRVE
ncbi:unnamed protein product [Rhizoctonia solani]|uniref:Enoyl reductase (ER) domain-containing protein n=1 Tax=Rhizoctonia solani TaxID=456999 RepID=A0A8H3BXE9_9AGAM|nr:unnamed protein product [Rhizoctonia solani]